MRSDAREWISAREVGTWSSTDPANVTENGSRVEVRQVPWSIRLFGETPVHFIVLDKAKLSPQDAAYISSLQSLFPEAEGIYIDEPGLTTCWPLTNHDSLLE